MTEPISYKDTLNLPKTNFDMKANLTQREPVMLKKWQQENLYQQIRSARKPPALPGVSSTYKGKWVLHDGPPYANGDIHMGHLINKVLKDIVVKFRTMQGYDSPYIPGWDCHGLPIESAIQKDLGPKFRELSKDQVRQKCHDYAMKYVKLQSDSFQRLGIFFGPGEQDRYLTLNPKYEGGVLDVLAELVKRDLVYRKKKPVHWCTFDRTALAEAELEYQTKKDNSIYVEFEVGPLDTLTPQSKAAQEFVGSLREFGKNISLMIWTTTPWTLPANRAVAVHPDYEYIMAWYRLPNDPPKPDYSRCVILATGPNDEDGPAGKVLELALERGQITDYECRPPVSGKELVEMGLKYRHPLDPTRLQPVVLADYVTLEDGTGLVHTAPGHGKEDYQTGLKYGLEIYNPVLADGKYDDTVPDFLRGQSIWAANDMILDKLKQTGALFHHQQFDHEYPHCWRCRKPVIFRATEQWFVRAGAPETPGGSPGLPRSTEPAASPTRTPETPGGSPGLRLSPEPAASPTLWSTAKRFVNAVQWIPEWGKNRIDGMLDTRPDWCISRQRSWGVPIPAFFDDKGNILFSEKSVRHIADYFRQHGADSWYTHTPEQILGTDRWTDTAITPDGKEVLSFEFCVLSLQKGSDILDVWFESGASHHAVLECTHPELGYPANLYLEGSDQHRGWFQSSLL
jgi:isoleucyl-tRNA synthetase